MFTNPIIQSTLNQFNGASFGYLVGFGMYSSPDTVFYYVMDYWNDKVYILDDEWKIISSNTLIVPII